MALFLFWALRPDYRRLKNLDSCFHYNVNQQYNTDWLVLVLYLFMSCDHMVPPRPQLWRSNAPSCRLWRALIRILLFWGTRCHTPVQLTHHARSMALCFAISTPLCEGNDCRCVRKPLVGTRRSKQETNKHYGSFHFSFWTTAVLLPKIVGVPPATFPPAWLPILHPDSYFHSLFRECGYL